MSQGPAAMAGTASILQTPWPAGQMMAPSDRGVLNSRPTRTDLSPAPARQGLPISGGFMCRSNTSLTSSNPSFYMPGSSSMVTGMTTGPIVAGSYIADMTDPIDAMVANALRSLDSWTASKLGLQRLGGGKYVIDGRKVTIRWTTNGCLMASEDEVLNPQDSEMELQAYLVQAGNVAASLSGQTGDMPKIARIPKERRLTFVDSEAPEKHLSKHIEKLGNERCESMRLAVEQARLREEAASFYESSRFGTVNQLSSQNLPLPPPPPQLPRQVPFYAS
jgi:hypothetical protein